MSNPRVGLLDENLNIISSSNPLPTLNYSGLVPESYDDIALTYIATGDGIGEVETVVYEKDSVVIATLTLSYNSDDKLVSVVRS